MSNFEYNIIRQKLKKKVSDIINILPWLQLVPLQPGLHIHVLGNTQVPLIQSEQIAKIIFYFYLLKLIIRKNGKLLLI